MCTAEFPRVLYLIRACSPGSPCSWSMRRLLVRVRPGEPRLQVVLPRSHRAHVTGADVDHPVVEPEAVPHVVALVSRSSWWSQESPGRDDYLLHLRELVDPPPPLSERPRADLLLAAETPTILISSSDGSMTSSILIAVSRCSLVAIR